MSSLAIGQVLEVTAEKLAFGGSAIARHEGAVLFVPFAAPGDHLRVVVTEADKRFYRATIQQVLQPSPHRREPKCSLFGKCGGCQFQHVTYEEQVRQKAEIVRDAIVRIGGFDWQQPIRVHTGEEWGYRSRTQLKCEPGALGFNRPETKTVIDVPTCPVLAPALNEALPQVRAAIATLGDDQLPYQVEGSCGANGALFSPDLPGMKKDLVEHRVCGFSYLIEPDSFFQGNRFLVDSLVQGAVAGEQGKLCYDLYAGIGLFSLPLAKAFGEVVAVEDERRAVLLGRVACHRNDVRNVGYVRDSVEGFLRAKRAVPDLVLMDPPRLGAKPAIPGLLQLRAPRIVYVSCDPNTLARDLKELCAGGYLLESVEAWDMFPQTHHVECVARLRLA